MIGILVIGDWKLDGHGVPTPNTQRPTSNIQNFIQTSCMFSQDSVLY